MLSMHSAPVLNVKNPRKEEKSVGTKHNIEEDIGPISFLFFFFLIFSFVSFVVAFVAFVASFENISSNNPMQSKTAVSLWYFNTRFSLKLLIFGWFFVCVCLYSMCDERRTSLNKRNKWKWAKMRDPDKSKNYISRLTKQKINNHKMTFWPLRFPPNGISTPTKQHQLQQQQQNTNVSKKGRRKPNQTKPNRFDRMCCSMLFASTLFSAGFLNVNQLEFYFLKQHKMTCSFPLEIFVVFFVPINSGSILFLLSYFVRFFPFFALEWKIVFGFIVILLCFFFGIWLELLKSLIHIPTGHNEKFVYFEWEHYFGFVVVIFILWFCAFPSGYIITERETKVSDYYYTIWRVMLLVSYRSREILCIMTTQSNFERHRKITNSGYFHKSHTRLFYFFLLRINHKSENLFQNRLRCVRNKR